MRSSRLALLTKSVSLASLTFCLIALAVTTWRWPLVNDASLMHYACFMMDHGLAPYRDIKDINLPGAYLADWTVMHTLGSGPAAWRMYDFLLDAAGIGAMIAIARPNLFAGYFAGVLFALFHGRDGVGQSGQRDMTMAVLLLWAYFFATFPSIRRRKLLFAAFSGVLCGTAFTIKPTVIFFLLLFGILLWKTRDGKGIHALAAYAAGLCVPSAMAFAFLLYEHSVWAFWRVSRSLIAYHASLGRINLLLLLHDALTGTLLPVSLLSVGFFVLMRKWRSGPIPALSAAVVCGFLSFALQGKGYLYQRYPMIAFLFLAFSLLSVEAMNAKARIRWAGLLCVAIFGAVVPALYVRRASRDFWRETQLVTSLSADLEIAEAGRFKQEHSMH